MGLGSLFKPGCGMASSHASTLIAWALFRQIRAPRPRTPRDHPTESCGGRQRCDRRRALGVNSKISRASSPVTVPPFQHRSGSFRFARRAVRRGCPLPRTSGATARFPSGHRSAAIRSAARAVRRSTWPREERGHNWHRQRLNRAERNDAPHELRRQVFARGRELKGRLGGARQRRGATEEARTGPRAASVSLLWRAFQQHLEQRLTSQAEPRAKRSILFSQ